MSDKLTFLKAHNMSHFFTYLSFTLVSRYTLNDPVIFLLQFSVSEIAIHNAYSVCCVQYMPYILYLGRRRSKVATNLIINLGHHHVYSKGQLSWRNFYLLNRELNEKCSLPCFMMTYIRLMHIQCLPDLTNRLGPGELFIR